MLLQHVGELSYLFAFLRATHELLTHDREFDFGLAAGFAIVIRLVEVTDALLGLEVVWPCLLAMELDAAQLIGAD